MTMKENIRKTVHAPIQVNNFMQIAMGSHLLSPKAAKQVGKKKSATNVGGHLRRVSSVSYTHLTLPTILRV